MSWMFCSLSGGERIIHPRYFILVLRCDNLPSRPAHLRPHSMIPTFSDQFWRVSAGNERNPVRKLHVFWQQPAPMPTNLFLYGFGCPVMVFPVHVTAQAERYGDNRYQIKCSMENHLASLNIKIQMKFHLKVVCKLGKVSGTVFLVVHGKIHCGGFVLLKIMMFWEPTALNFHRESRYYKQCL